MKPVSKLASLFSQKETLSEGQSARLKGGDDKRPPICLPGIPPVPRPNSVINALTGGGNSQ